MVRMMQAKGLKRRHAMVSSPERSGNGVPVAGMVRGHDILTQGLIGLIEYSYHQGIPSFPEAHLQRTLG
jgi:hypothetical protein